MDNRESENKRATMLCVSSASLEAKHNNLCLDMSLKRIVMQHGYIGRVYLLYICVAGSVKKAKKNQVLGIVFRMRSNRRDFLTLKVECKA